MGALTGTPTQEIKMGKKIDISKVVLDHFYIKQAIYPSDPIERYQQEQKLTYQRYLDDPERDKHYDLYYNKNGELWPYIGGRTQWQLECKDCKTICWRRQDNIKNNHAQSCSICKQPRLQDDYTLHYVKGAPINPKDDLRGQTFFDLFVTYKQPYNAGNGHSVYTCLCKLCGQEEDFRDDDLKRGNVTCCSNCREDKYDSKLEEKTAKILKELNIPFHVKKKFNDLLGINNGKLSYDFEINYNNYNILIECQGEQHYRPAFDKSYFPTQQEHDRRKKEYAKLHNYILIEIKYDCKNIKQYLIDILSNL